VVEYSVCIAWLVFGIEKACFLIIRGRSCGFNGSRQIPGGFEIILTFPVDISSFFSAEKNEAKRSLKKRCIHRSSLLCQPVFSGHRSRESMLSISQIIVGRKPHLRVLFTTLSEAYCAMAYVSNPKVPTGHSQEIWVLNKLGTARIACDARK
jgi:hypothetical protein